MAEIDLGYRASGGLPIGAHIDIEQGASAPPGFIPRGSAQTLLQSAYPDLFDQIGIKANVAPTGTWTKNTAGVPNTTDYLRHVAYANGVYVAVGDSDAVWTATDPTGTWTKNTAGVPGVNHSLRYVGYDEVSGLWIATTTNSYIWTASDPAGTWTYRSGYSNVNYTKWVLFGGYLVFASANPFNNYLYYTADPTVVPNRIDLGPPTNGKGFYTVETDGKHLIAGGGDGELWVTNDLFSGWTGVSPGGSLLDIEAILKVSGTWIAVGGDVHAYATNPYGTWTKFTSTLLREFGVSSYIHDPDSGYVLNANQLSSLIVTSVDPINDAYSYQSLNAQPSGIGIGPSHWIIVGNSGSLWTQPRQSYNPSTQFYLPARQHTNDGLQLAIKAE